MSSTDDFYPEVDSLNLTDTVSKAQVNLNEEDGGQTRYLVK